MAPTYAWVLWEPIADMAEHQETITMGNWGQNCPMGPMYGAGSATLAATVVRQGT